MGKIICDICGTSYPDIADSCPICGCSRDAASDFLKDDFMHDEFSDMASVNIGVQTAKKKKEIFDFDEVLHKPAWKPPKLPTGNRQTPDRNQSVRSYPPDPAVSGKFPASHRRQSEKSAFPIPLSS